MFNPEQFMTTNYSEANSTKIIPVPEGEYPAQVKSVGFRQFDRDDDSSSTVCEVVWEPQDLDGSIKASTGREGATVRQSVWLDLSPQGNLDFGDGKNIGLGRLREAIGQNRPGQPWNFSMLVGGSGRVLVHHRTDSKTGDVYAEVKKVAAL